MNQESKTLLSAAAALLVIFIAATALFTFFENRHRRSKDPPLEEVTLFKSAYWGIVTLSTVGYGDISAYSVEGKIITIFLIIVGLTVYVSVISKFGSFIIGRGLKEAKGLKKCEYENHVVVLGMNDIIEEAIRQLSHGECKIAAVVETSEDVDRAVMLGVFPILGDPTQPDSLEMANVGKADTVLINLQDDSKTILAALACRKVTKSIKVVASIKQRQLIELVKESGVESVISPEALTGRMLASAVFEPHVIDFVDDVTSGVEGADLREFNVRGTSIAGSRVGDALTSLRRATGALIVGLVRLDGIAQEITNPGDDEIIGEGDKVILLGYEDQFNKVRNFLGQKSKAT